MSSDWEDLFEGKRKRDHHSKHHADRPRDESSDPHERTPWEDDSGFYTAQRKHGKGLEHALPALLASPKRGLWIALGLGILLVGLLILLFLLWAFWPFWATLSAQLRAADWAGLAERLRKLLAVLPGQ